MSAPVSERLLAALRLTWEIAGQPLSDLALAALACDLAAYPEEAVLAALARVRREARRPTLADVLDRLPGGHPAPEEAWALIAPALTDERRTVVWTEEMAAAWDVARGLAADPAAARRAFLEVYTRAVGQARAAGRLPRWSVSLGWDPAQRDAAIQAAVAMGRLPARPGLAGPGPCTVSESVAAVAARVLEAR